MNRVLILLLFSLFSCSTSNSVIKNDIPEFRKKHIKSLMVENGPITSKDQKYLTFYDIDSKYECQCEYEYSKDQKVVTFTTFSGIEKQYRIHGTAHCKVAGKVIGLQLYESMRLLKNPMYKNYLFLPFKDLTNGDETYGGGRYMDYNKSEIVDGKLILDFNKCYNPYCAYSDGYNCPIPPIENHLNIAIHAGEKMFQKTK